MPRYELFIHRERASKITVGGLCGTEYYANDDLAIENFLKEAESRQADFDNPIPDKVVVGSIYRSAIGKPPQLVARFVLRGEIEPEQVQTVDYIPIRKPKSVLPKKPQQKFLG